MAIIFQTYNRADSRYLVNVTTNPHDADLWVYSVSNAAGHRGDLIWYFTENRAEATSSIFLCSFAEAMVRVFFVSSHSDACWRNPSKERGNRFF